MSKVCTLTFGRVYSPSSSRTYEHSNQILHIPEINDTTSATFLSTYGFVSTDRVLNLSIQLPIRCSAEDMGKTFNNLRVVIFNKFTGTINNSSSSDTAWFTYSSTNPNTDNMAIKWNNQGIRNYGFCKTAIDAGRLIGTPLAYFDASFTFSSTKQEMDLTLNSSNSTITITEAGKDINNWAPTGYNVADGHGLFVGFYNTAADFWSDISGYSGLNWGWYNSSDCTPYVYVNVTAGNNTVKYYNGTTWKDCEVYYCKNGVFVPCEVSYCNGSSWIPIG